MLPPLPPPPLACGRGQEEESRSCNGRSPPPTPPYGRTVRAPDADLASGHARTAAASAADPSSRSPSALPLPPTLAEEEAAAAALRAAAAASSRASCCCRRSAHGAPPPRKYCLLRAAKSGTACSGGLAMETRSQPMPQSIMRRFVSWCEDGGGRMEDGGWGGGAVHHAPPPLHLLHCTCARVGSTSKAPSPPVSTMMFCKGGGERE